ncbi:MAG: hypothetical protein AAF721_07895 [Myxococcota bacterium]
MSLLGLGVIAAAAPSGCQDHGCADEQAERQPDGSRVCPDPAE